VKRLFGSLDEGLGRVQFLDAFPTQPCLSQDVVTPQWHWNQEQLYFQPSPHKNLSLEEPEFCIGLLATQRGSKEDMDLVCKWLRQALQGGLGSRVAAGYGRPKSQNQQETESQLVYKIPFKLWTGGLYGADPPTKKNKYQGTPELRPTAFRGILRYWFRAIALALYPPLQVKRLEAELFGGIEVNTGGNQTSAIRGSIDLWLTDEVYDLISQSPYLYKYEGNICLGVRRQLDRDHLKLAKNLLQLASHLGGVGRGSRRPLHWNQPPGWRGCHWELTDERKLHCLRKSWKGLLRSIRDSLLAMETPEAPPHDLSPGQPEKRRQDVLNSSSHIFLVPCGNLQHPEKVKNWKPSDRNEQEQLRGEALNLLYEPEFKGASPQNNAGNSHVGGAVTEGEKLGTPSYVTVASNFAPNRAYQAVVVFGATRHRDRRAFCNRLNEMANVKSISLKFLYDEVQT
jgi:CRISPR-associated protein Cmr6